MVAMLDHSALRFTFDFYFQIKEVLAHNEFVQFTVEGLPALPIAQLLKMLKVNEH